MARTTIVAVACATGYVLFGPLVAADTQTRSQPRLAAVQFAITHNLRLPTQGLVVATDTDLGLIHATPVPRPASEVADETRAIAQLVGAVKTGRVGEFLECPTRHVCYPRNVAVLVVNDQIVESSSVVIKLFSPADKPGGPISLTTAAVRIERRNGGWVGTEYSHAPETLSRIR